MSAAWRKQLKQPLQHKITARIAWEEEAWRVSEASIIALGSRISGYRKGKAPEKHMCMHCL